MKKTVKKPAAPKKRNYGIPKRKTPVVHEPTKYYKTISDRLGRRKIEVPPPGTPKPKRKP